MEISAIAPPITCFYEDLILVMGFIISGARATGLPVLKNFCGKEGFHF